MEYSYYSGRKKLRLSKKTSFFLCQIQLNSGVKKLSNLLKYGGKYGIINLGDRHG